MSLWSARWLCSIVFVREFCQAHMLACYLGRNGYMPAKCYARPWLRLKERNNGVFLPEGKREDAVWSLQIKKMWNLHVEPALNVKTTNVPPRGWNYTNALHFARACVLRTIYDVSQKPAWSLFHRLLSGKYTLLPGKYSLLSGKYTT
jgi:hypothetical protein